MAIDAIKIWLEKIKGGWSSVFGLIVAVGIVGGASLLLFSQVSTEEITRVEWLAFGVAVVVVVAIWAASRRYPKVSRNRYGFVVAIDTDSSESLIRLRREFIRPLKQRVGRTGAESVQFIELPSHLGPVETPEDAKRVLDKTRASLALFGHATESDIGGEAHFVVDLDWFVRHEPLPVETSRQLSQEMGRAHARRSIIRKESAILTFEVTGSWLDLTARYIAGLAILFSADLDRAEPQLLEVRNALADKKRSELPPHLAEIRSRVNYWMARLYEMQLNVIYRDYDWHRNPDFLREAEPILDKLEVLDPQSYQGSLLRAITEFVFRRDIKAARRALRRCQNKADATWHYSEAFLYAYEGDLVRARSQYKRAFRGSLKDPSVALQSELFLDSVLDEEPDKIGLHLCLGLIRYHAKQDYGAAILSFTEFAKRGSEDPDLTPHVTVANTYIAQARAELKRALAAESQQEVRPLV